MALVSIKCTSCGASLSPREERGSYTCDYCGARFEVRPFGIDVVVVEPGPVKTRFGDTAIAGIRGPADSPYAALNRALAERIREAYEGPMARFAAEPDAVARVIETAISAPHPRTRYPVTAAARILMALRCWLPDRAFDGFLRTQFPQTSAR